MASVCKRVTYSGRVQGVGFRYTAQGLAAGQPVTGYVRNLPSGEVELVAEGETAAVEKYLAAVGRRMANCIARTRVEDVEPLGLSDFRIRT
jgi:acylphosphatase